MKYFLICFLLLRISAAAAQTPPPAAEDIPQVQSYRVTSNDDCLKQLPSGEAQKVRQSLKPYEECQKRLAYLLSQKEDNKKGAEKAAAEKAATPETPRNYVRVQEPKADTAPAK